MKDHVKLLIAGILLVTAAHSLAAIRYVNLNNVNPAPPYTDWASAATNIQDAVDAAKAGDTVLVTNGVYAAGGRVVYGTMMNRVGLVKPLTVISANGPAVTLIVGVGENGDVARCVYLGSNTVLSGFTLTNGCTQGDGDALLEQSGGGSWSEESGVVTNCTLSGNRASWSGGGAYAGTLKNCALTGNSANYGGGASSATLNNCSVSGNLGGSIGGGCYNCTLNICTLSTNTGYVGGGASGGTLNNCILSRNWTPATGGGALNAILNNCALDGNSSVYGGGAYYSTLNTCSLSANDAYFGGGAAASTLNNCTLSTNGGYNGGGACWSTLNGCWVNGNWGALGGGACWTVLNSCSVCSNWASSDGGGAYGATLNNCTLSANSATNTGGGASASSLTNSIAYYNTAPSGANYSDSTLAYCCTTPLAPGLGNITNEPLFVDLSTGNIRLRSNSPCINAGGNVYAPGTADLDGRPRVVGPNVDIGAYESQVEFITWLQQYGLPIDGSADFRDLDGDGMNNWQEYRCGTDPTNALSVLRLIAPSPIGRDLAVSWQSVPGVNYTVEWSTNLAVPPVFSPLVTNLPGQPGSMTFVDTNAPGVARLYRVGVRSP